MGEGDFWKWSSADKRSIKCLYEPAVGFEVDPIVHFESLDRMVCGVCGTFPVLVPIHVPSGRLPCQICAGEEVESTSYTLTYGRHRTRTRLMFIVDTCCEQEQLRSLLQQLIATVHRFREASIAIISMEESGKVVLHSATNRVSVDISRSKVERYLKNLDFNYFAKYLPTEPSALWLKDYQQITKVLSEIKATGSLNSNAKKRCKRATGLAMFFAASAFRKFSGSFHDHVIGFLNGPCTKGPGKVISRDRKSYIRQFTQLNDGKAEFLKPSKDFYGKLKAMFDTTNFNFFIASLDQIGLLELSPMFNFGLMTAVSQYDFFSDNYFKDAWIKFIDILNDDISIYDAKLSVITSKGVLLKDDHLHPLKGRESNVFFSRFILNPPELSIPIIFSQKESARNQEYIQIQFSYEKGSKQYTRIDNIAIHKRDGVIENKSNVKVEASILFKHLAQAVLKNGTLGTSSSQALINYLDTQCKLVYNQLPVKQGAEYLRYCYNLRRTPLLLERNVSPDEKVLYALNIINSNLEKCMLICIPSVIAFNNRTRRMLQFEPEIFNSQATMVIHCGDFIVVRNSTENLDSRHAEEYAETLLEDSSSFNKPKYIRTRSGDSNDRYIKSKLLLTHKLETQLLNTEDITFPQFSTIINK